MNIFVLSSEEIRNPLAGEIADLALMLHERGLMERSGSISMRYGRRMLITSSGADMSALRSEHFVEVVDYNPVTDTVLLIGTHEPPPETPLHWLLYSRDDINVVLYGMLFGKALSAAELEAPPEGLMGAMAVLKELKNSHAVKIKGGTGVMVGVSIAEIRRRFQ